MRLGYGCSSIGFGLAKGPSSAGYFEYLVFSVATSTKPLK